MNAKEGMRRLGVLLGVIGSIICGFHGASAERELMRTRADHKKFESLMGLPVMRRVAKAVKDQNNWFERNGPTRNLLIPPPPPSFVPDRPARIDGFKFETDFDHSSVAKVYVDSEGIKEVSIDTRGTVSSFELLTGAWVHRTESPGPLEYLVPLLYPFVGFLVPWGAVRVLTWVGTGFFQPGR